MWTRANYVPVALFSLKPSAATSSGGRTLITPTPFSIKMALLDVLLRTQGKETGRRYWPAIRDLQVRIALPSKIVVINTFTKIVRPKKNGPSEDRGTGLVTPFGSTIAYREYVHYGGPLEIAFQMGNGDGMPQVLRELLPHITYLGKRGGFIQLQAPVDDCDETVFNKDQEWVLLTTDQASFALTGTLQMLDDCGPAMTFEHADIYSGKRISIGKERVMRHIVLPYEVARSSRGYTLYQRIEEP
jgi:hypothetical protein